MSDEEQSGDLQQDEAPKDASLEHQRLGGREPLRTILSLSIGPILAQVTGALKGIISTVWVSTALGEIALTTMSTIGVFDGISRAFGFFVSSSGASKISQLYGQHREDEASQVVVDLIRISLICGIIVPAILGPTARPLCEWLGASEEVTVQSQEYMLPINVMTFSTVLFVGLGGCLQGEGRSMFFSILNVISLIVNMCVLDPILLLACKTGIWGASFAQGLSELIPAVIIFVMYFKGKFGVKPKLKQFLKCFSPHTLPSLKVGTSQLIANVSQLIPSILVRKFIGLSVGDNFNDAMAGYNTVIRIMILTNSVILAFTAGYVPPASYAHARKDYRRWFKLSFHCIWLAFAWGSFTAILTWTIPREISMMFGKSEGYLEMSSQMIRVSNSLGFLIFGRFCGVSMLQSMQMGFASSVFSLSSHFLSIIVFSCILYFTDKHNAVRLIWTYALSISFGFIACIIAMIVPVKRMLQFMRTHESKSTSEINSLDAEGNIIDPIENPEQGEKLVDNHVDEL